MQRIRSLALMLATLAGVVVLVAAPVAADSGSDGGGSGSSGDGGSSQTSGSGSSDTSSSGDSNTSNTSDTSSTDQTEAETTSDSSGNVRDVLDQLRQDAKDALKHMREQEHGNSSEHGRQLACENRQTTINNRVSNFADAAQRHLGVFTDIFTKVQSFYTTKGLTVSNYDALVATATAKQTAAQAAVDALKSLDVNIDCSQPDPAQTLETVKTAVSNARTALQDYRKAIKDLIVAIGNALDAQDSTSTSGGN